MISRGRGNRLFGFRGWGVFRCSGWDLLGLRIVNFCNNFLCIGYGSFLRLLWGLPWARFLHEGGFLDRLFISDNRLAWLSSNSIILQITSTPISSTSSYTPYLAVDPYTPKTKTSPKSAHTSKLQTENTEQ